MHAADIQIFTYHEATLFFPRRCLQIHRPGEQNESRFEKKNCDLSSIARSGGLLLDVSLV